MSFNSVHFLMFFPIVVLILFVIPKRLRKYWLLIASYYFYLSWDYRYAIFLVFSTLTTYLAGRLIGRKEASKSVRKAVCGVCIAANLAIILVFKYQNFFIDNINSVFGSEIGAVDLLIPIGISFYIFQAVGYIIDVYRDSVEAEKNIVNYALFVSMFTRICAGPIERAGNILPQIKRLESKTLFDGDRVVRGLLLMGWGTVEKLVISDRIAVAVDKVFGNYTEYGLTTVVFATVLFALQIYCDFEGYTNIARGAAEVMGFDIITNFKQPYLATSIVDFWNRWHISLTGWFRDYLYIPLGGNRKGKIRQYFNILIVFLVSGLWHGAEWSFILWGAWHGIAQIISHARLKGKVVSDMSFSARLLRRIRTFIIVDAAWFLFRAGTMKEAVDIVRSAATRIGDFSMMTGLLDLSNWRILGMGLLSLIVVDCLKENGCDVRKKILEQQVWFRIIVYVLLILACVFLGVNSGDDIAHSFIYFKF